MTDETSRDVMDAWGYSLNNMGNSLAMFTSLVGNSLAMFTSLVGNSLAVYVHFSSEQEAVGQCSDCLSAPWTLMCRQLYVRSICSSLNIWSIDCRLQCARSIHTTEARQSRKLSVYIDIQWAQTYYQLVLNGDNFLKLASAVVSSLSHLIRGIYSWHTFFNKYIHILRVAYTQASALLSAHADTRTRTHIHTKTTVTWPSRAADQKKSPKQTAVN